jgi:hypothetical protein
LAGAAALLILVPASPVDAGRDGGHGRRHVQVTVGPPQAVGGDFGCDPTDPTRCVGTFRNVRTLSGGFSGTAYQVGSAALLADGTYQGTGLVLFTGTVDRCGSGTLMILETGLLDPASGPSGGSWRIIGGGGTGDLTDVSGELVQSAASEVMTGRIRCR